MNARFALDLLTAKGHAPLLSYLIQREYFTIDSAWFAKSPQVYS